MALATITINADANLGGTTQAPVFIGTSPPAVLANGTLWFQSEQGVLLCYYVDADSGQWVRVG